jgi:hypothetical protein
MRLAVAVLLAVLPAKSPTPAFRPEQAIDYAKQIDVSKLDSKLPSEGLAHWISARFSPKADVIWRTGTCDLRPEYPPPVDGNPLCVEFLFEVGRLGVWGHIIVGTLERGVTGAPKFDRVSVEKRPSLHFEHCRRLSGLPALLARLAKEMESPTPTPRSSP